MEPAYILHRKVYKESSLILDVFTLNHGRISLIAKGAYKAKSIRGAQLQVFQPLMIDWVGKGSLPTLTKVDVPSPRFNLSGVSLYAGYYLNELLLRLLPELDPHQLLFEYYAETLSGFSSNVDLKFLLRRIELLLLHEIGQLPTLTFDSNGVEIEAGIGYVLSADNQLVARASFGGAEDAVVSGEELQALVALFGPSNQAQNFDGSRTVANKNYSSARLRLFMAGLLDKALDGKPLKSREMMRDYMRLSKN